MLEVAKLGAHLLGSKVSLISSVGETQSPLGLFLLLGGPQSPSLGKSVPMPLVSFYLPFLANATFCLDLLHLYLPLPIMHFPLPPCWVLYLSTWRSASQEAWWYAGN